MFAFVLWKNKLLKLFRLYFVSILKFVTNFLVIFKDFDENLSEYNEYFHEVIVNSVKGSLTQIVPDYAHLSLHSLTQESRQT